MLLIFKLVNTQRCTAARLNSDNTEGLHSYENDDPQWGLLLFLIDFLHLEVLKRSASILAQRPDMGGELAGLLENEY